MDDLQISVAMATFNGASYLREQLESIARQQHPPCELVICDDGSSDDTVGIIRDFASTAPFEVRLFENETNLGYADNFLKCASLCRGRWIAFCDQDDVWLPEKLARVRATIERWKSAELVMVAHSSDLVHEDLSPTGRRVPDFKRDELRGRNSLHGICCVVGFSMVFRADLLAGIDASFRPLDYTWHPRNAWPAHDQWVCMLANALGEVAYISDSLALWRSHTSSVTGRPSDLSLLGDVRQAAVAVQPDTYATLSVMAQKSADSFRRMIDTTQGERKARVETAESNYARLARIYSCRAALYRTGDLLSRLRGVVSILTSQGYWGNSFFSLGTRSFIKDFAFALGLLE